MSSEKQKIAGSLFWSYGERISSQLVSLLVSVILARLLAPEDYGVISIIMIFITLCDAIVTGGFGNSIVQKQDADELDVNTMFCCSVVISLALYILLFGTAPVIANFYNMPEMCLLLRVLGIRLLFSGINSIQRAWVQKQLLFKKFFVSSILGTMLSAVVGIVMAYKNAGAWALVGQYLTNTIVNSIVLYILSDWHPKFNFSWRRAGEMLSFGWKVLVTTVVYTVENDLRSLIVGKKFGSADLAYYDQGKKFPNLLVTNVNSSISNVIFPVLSQNQDNRKTMIRYCRRSVRTGMYLLSPLLIGLVAIADTFIITILSDKWSPCIPYLRILTLVFLVRPFTTTCQQSILSVGRSDVTLKIEIIVNAVAIVLLFFAVFGMESVLWIAYGTFMTETVSLVLFMYYENKIIGYQLREQLQDILPYLFISMIMGVIAYFLQFVFGTSLLALISQIVVGAVFYIGISFFMSLEPFVYLVKLLVERVRNERVNKCLEKILGRSK